MDSIPLKILKTRKVKTCMRAHSTDAGIDFFIPEDLSEQAFLEKCKVTGVTPRYELTGGVSTSYYVSKITLSPGQSVLIPSGIKMKIPHGYALIFFNKSGVASKKHLDVGACVSGDTIIETNLGKFSAKTLTKEFCDFNKIKIWLPSNSVTAPPNKKVMSKIRKLLK